jgi:sulfotransferase family protein
VSQRPVLPNFLVIGSAKSGTTSLAHYLRAHPNAYMPRFEPHYFTAERRWKLGQAWYENQFKEAEDAIAVGEKSASYSRHPLYPGVPGRIADLLPDVHIVYLVRHPLDRMRSEYLHRRLNGKETRPLDEAVRADPSYLDTSRYALQIHRYLEHFPRDQLLVLTAEQLRHARHASLDRVQEFLGLDPAWEPPELGREYNRTAQKRARRPIPRPLKRLLDASLQVGVSPRTVERLSYRPVATKVDQTRIVFSDEVRARLEDELCDDVRRLRGYLDPEFDGWGIG